MECNLNLNLKSRYIFRFKSGGNQEKFSNKNKKSFFKNIISPFDDFIIQANWRWKFMIFEEECLLVNNKQKVPVGNPKKKTLQKKKM